MSEMGNVSKAQNGQETPEEVRTFSRRSLIKGAGLVTAGAVAGIVVDRLFEAGQDQLPPDDVSAADYDSIKRAGDKAREQARALQVLINTTIQTKKPTDISVLDGSMIIVRDRIGTPVWKIYHPILLGEPPEIDDLDKNFWFGVQSPDPGGIGRPPSVRVWAELFDRMSMSYHVRAGQSSLAASQVSVLVMPPAPQASAANGAVAFEYNEFTPDHWQHRSDDPSQLIAPGLHIAIETQAV